MSKNIQISFNYEGHTFSHSFNHKDETKSIIEKFCEMHSINKDSVFFYMEAIF